MDARFRPLPPVLTLSTRCSRTLRLSTVARVARDADLDGLDIDPSEAVLPGPSALATVSEKFALPIRSVWLPAPSVWMGWRRKHARDAMLAAARASFASVVVVDLPLGSDRRPSRSLLTSTTEAFRASVRPGTRICVGLRPRQLEGGRAHLVELTALRRLAEEWDFEIALDLAGPIDPRWEAEAAIARLGARLGLMRLETEAVTGPPFGRCRAAARALSAAIDGGHPTEYALVPRPPLWHPDRGRAMADASLVASRRVRARYAAVEAQRLSDTYPSPTPKHRGQQPA